MKYLMSPDLYFSLCQVRGFTDMNGDTYQKHIILILGDSLSSETKEKIMNSQSVEEALKLIDIPYTHNME
jgi:hypothetical protein